MLTGRMTCVRRRICRYRTEFSLWVIGAASMIVATDVRNMSEFQKETLLQTQMLAIHQDALGISGGLVYSDPDSPSCAATVKHGHPVGGSSPCGQMWARPLSDGRWAMALYNRHNASATVNGQFSHLPPQPQSTIMGTNPHAGPAPSKLAVRDVWEAQNLGSHTAGTRQLPLLFGTACFRPFSPEGVLVHCRV
jgi:alpha-galactosidase|eukprot:COSAG02_NODE_4080_length_5818_cov_17.059101_5_plen_193_part_00